MRSDASGCVRMHSGAFGTFWKIRLKNSVLGHFCEVFEAFMLLFIIFWFHFGPQSLCGVSWLSHCDFLRHGVVVFVILFSNEGSVFN